MVQSMAVGVVVVITGGGGSTPGVAGGGGGGSSYVREQDENGKVRLCRLFLQISLSCLCIAMLSVHTYPLLSLPHFRGLYCNLHARGLFAGTSRYGVGTNTCRVHTTC